MSQPNRLIDEKSPYLLQHAHNPVDWFPWGEEAFNKAKSEDKPVFLSIGYSTCHWCHVMAHESFEDVEVAQLLNESFVSIKVDREERPDVDQLYMTVCQMMTGGGGWPLTIMMTPDREPFFAGTYFPKESRQGRIGMLELIPRVASIWQRERSEISSTIEKVKSALSQLELAPTEHELGPETLDKAYDHLLKEFDTQFGGFGTAPKFPTPHRLTFLLSHWDRTGQKQALSMASETLKHMASGGIHDHLGGGFHRYSTDRSWLLPHFEKMLYDQALLALAFTEAFQAMGNKQFAHITREILSYVTRDMTSPEGGFYSAEDADSEGVEGKFYVWGKSEIDSILGEEAALFCAAYGIRDEGNFLEEATRERTGANILHVPSELAGIVAQFGISEEELEASLKRSRELLFNKREKRVHPHKDDKILTDWNGLMIAALAKAARVLGEDSYANRAVKASDFIEQHLTTAGGHLLHRHREGESAVDGFLDDYAFYIWGLLELYETKFDPKYFRRALELHKQLVSQFWDEENGGFFFSSADSSDLIIRMKETYDGALPSGNSVALNNLVRLSHMTGDLSFRKRADELVRGLGEKVQHVPAAHAHFLSALELIHGSPAEIVIVGERGDSETDAMLSRVRALYKPNCVVLLRESDSQSELAELAPFTAEMSKREGKATAYVCVDHVCDVPTHDPDHMIERLKS